MKAADTDPRLCAAIVDRHTFNGTSSEPAPTPTATQARQAASLRWVPMKLRLAPDVVSNQIDILSGSFFAVTGVIGIRSGGATQRPKAV